MILWFGKKKKKEELKQAGAAMELPELSAEELAAKEAEEARLAAEKEEIERKVAEANRAWEERQAREAKEAAEEAQRLEEEALKAEEARAAAQARADEAEAKRLEEEAERARKAKQEREAAQAKAAAELKLLEDRREAERLRVEREAAARAALEAEANDPGFMAKLGTGLSRSSSRLTSGLAVFGRRKLDDDTLEELEDLLISSDLGARVATRVTSSLAKERFDKEITEDEIRLALAEEITDVLRPREKIVDFSDGPRPRIVMFVGVNGSGKTTTIGKIASKLKEQGAKALLVAGDTFRAAAIEQLAVWGERADIPVMSKPIGSDAAGLVYEAIEKAKADDLDLVLIDTAGRLQNKTELMAELEKIVRVTRKLDPDAPHDVILVLDATVGQNALSQVEAFKSTAGVTGLVMTKLDGTAKGGVLVAIAEAHDLPIHFIGIGEKAEDLRPFSAEAFSKALVGAE
ncbi:MAG: signal recognition particle-docking protein FtsY [Alphaproteobacteria bacterium]|nr:signal recognition particle-docking protein FtsY [Hyphomonas sp.]MBR9808221.1 signal recognition particle-docking protein FtsY [Alphaproteobacteria bacterium]|tara:strand:- start:4700 stop:6085 length:1386 start_codon:yes stop_codon:yes gene_type:complete